MMQLHHTSLLVSRTTMNAATLLFETNMMQSRISHEIVQESFPAMGFSLEAFEPPNSIYPIFPISTFVDS